MTYNYPPSFSFAQWRRKYFTTGYDRLTTSGSLVLRYIPCYLVLRVQRQWRWDLTRSGCDLWVSLVLMVLLGNPAPHMTPHCLWTLGTLWADRDTWHTEFPHWTHYRWKGKVLLLPEVSLLSSGIPFVTAPTSYEAEWEKCQHVSSSHKTQT